LAIHKWFDVRLGVMLQWPIVFFPLKMSSITHLILLWSAAKYFCKIWWSFLEFCLSWQCILIFRLATKFDWKAWEEGIHAFFSAQLESCCGDCWWTEIWKVLPMLSLMKSMRGAWMKVCVSHTYFLLVLKMFSNGLIFVNLC
jgi:hypothetical protein